MLRFRWAAVLVAVVALLYGGHLWLSHDSSANSSSDASGVADGAAADGSSTGGSDGTSTGAKAGKSAPKSLGKTGSPESGSRNPAGNELAPVKTISEGPTPGLPTTLPGLKQPTKGPLLTPPLPHQASRRGGIVTGYPVSVLPAVPGSSVRTSSVSPSGSTLQVALDSTTANSPGSVLRFYRLRLAQAGFHDSQAPAVGGSTAVYFTRPGKDRLVVTVTPTSKTSCRYTIFGTLHAA